MGQVKGSNSQWPEAAEHGEHSEAKMIPWWHHQEIVFTLGVTRVIALEWQKRET